MSKKCGRCEKTVYPAEELRCLDKSWHKACFKCTECGMALTMKNYKGYNKLPYCNAHYPQISATVVADTPELRRIHQTNAMQSQAVYHADFVNNIRGTVTSMPDDMESKRIREQSSRGTAQDVNYTRPMRTPNEDEVAEPPRSYMPPTGQNQGRMLPIPGSQAPPPTQQAASQGATYVAMYDYDAQDDDEVGFLENDRIINCEVIDEGWVMGTVQRTGQKGMIPANYVEPA
jgi:hypothetical protein